MWIKLYLTFNFQLIIIIKNKYYYIYLIIIQTVYLFCHCSGACVNGCVYVLPMLNVKKICKVVILKCICLFIIGCFICFWHTFKWWHGISKTPWLIHVVTHHQTVHSEYIVSNWSRLKIGSYLFHYFGIRFVKSRKFYIIFQTFIYAILHTIK